MKARKNRMHIKMQHKAMKLMKLYIELKMQTKVLTTCHYKNNKKKLSAPNINLSLEVKKD